MSIRLISLLIVVVGFTLLPITAQSQESTLVHYRDTDGKVTKQSKETAKWLAEIAHEAGHVKLWLTLDYAYNPNLDEMTPEQIAAQDSEVAAGMDEILLPLIAQGDVQHIDVEATFFGPSCGIWATPKGLDGLLKDIRILQISGAESPP